MPEPASRQPDWPPLSPADQRLVDAWWAEVGPVYTGRGGKERFDWLLGRTLDFLEQQPRLFRYLYLSAAEAGRLQSACAQLYETLRGAVDVTDPAFRLCPTYEALIGGPAAPSSRSA
jgi:hypothetical protein